MDQAFDVLNYVIIHPIRQYPELAIFLTLALGFWLGSFKLGLFTLGVVTNTLLAGLMVGQLHISIPSVVQSTFFMIFLFAVGYGVGPQFFRAMKKDGLPQVAFTLLLSVTGLLCSYAIGKMLGYSPGLTAGLLAGGYTNSGTLGVATDNLKQLGLGAEQTNLAAIAYAVTYPFGAAGAAWFLSSLAPKLLGVDLAACCREYERKTGAGSSDPSASTAYRDIVARAYRLENAALSGRTARDIVAGLGAADTFVMRIRQGNEIIDPNRETIIKRGAAVVIAGHPRALLAAEEAVGPEVDDPELLAFPIEQLDVVVTSKKLPCRTIDELEEAQLSKYGHGVFVRKLMRAGREMKPTRDLQFRHWDVLTLLGVRKDVEGVAKFLGYADRATATSDVAFMGLGVLIGGLIGAFTIHVGGIPLSLSPSVGALLAGLACGYLRSVYRTFGRIPEAALWVFNNVGLNGFIAVVGLNAAGGLVSGLQQYGLTLFLAGVVVSLVPLIVGLYAGKYIFKFHPAILLGAVAGARTTTPALGALQEAASSSVPAIGYTVPYAVGRILMAICGVIVVLIMQ